MSKTASITIRIAPELKKRIEKLASKEDERTMSAYLRIKIVEWVAEEELRKKRPKSAN